MCMSCKLWSINYFYLSINILESFQVGAIIAKLRPSWNNYRKKLSNMNALNCVKTQVLFRPQDKNYDSIDFTLTYTKCRKE